MPVKKQLEACNKNWACVRRDNHPGRCRVTGPPEKGIVAAKGAKSPVLLNHDPLTPPEFRLSDKTIDILKNITSKAEAVNHPAHYGGDTTYETIKVLEAWLSREEFIGFAKGNAIKYHSRAGKKGDTTYEQDHGKALWYDAYLADYLKRHPE